MKTSHLLSVKTGSESPSPRRGVTFAPMSRLALARTAALTISRSSYFRTRKSRSSVSERA